MWQESSEFYLQQWFEKKNILSKRNHGQKQSFSLINEEERKKKSEQKTNNETEKWQKNIDLVAQHKTTNETKKKKKKEIQNINLAPCNFGLVDHQTPKVDEQLIIKTDNKFNSSKRKHFKTMDWQKRWKKYYLKTAG